MHRKLIDEAREILDVLRIPDGSDRAAVRRFAPLVVVPEDLRGLIEHTTTSAGKAATVCEEAARFRFRGVCIPDEPACARPSGLKVAVLVGLHRSKLHDAQHAAEADEIDMAIEVEDLKAELYKEVYHDIREVVQAAGSSRPVKVSIETARLELRQKIIACLIAEGAGASFIKTAADPSSGSATVEDVALIREVVGERLGVVAVGDIRDFGTAAALIGAGADRIGSAHSPEIVKPKPDPKDAGRLTHAWNSFNYQANQRMQAFQFYLVFIAALAGAYFKVIGNAGQGEQIVIAVVAALVSAAFGFLDIRNAELVHCAREALVKLEPEYGLIIRANEDLKSRRVGLERELGAKYLRSPRPIRRLIRACSNFRFVLKTIYFGVGVIAAAQAAYDLVQLIKQKWG